MDRPRKQEQERAQTDVTEVGENVLRMQLPIQLPGLGHVNTYALLDDRGAAIVDPGLPGPTTWKALLSRMKNAGLEPRHVHTVIVTHSHPDHFGTAGRLAKEAGADLVTHAAFHNPWLPHECADHIVCNERHRNLVLHQLPGREPRALQHRPGLIRNDMNIFPLLPSRANDAQCCAIPSCRQSAGIAMGKNGLIACNEFCSVLSHCLTEGNIFIENHL